MSHKRSTPKAGGSAAVNHLFDPEMSSLSSDGGAAAGGTASTPSRGRSHTPKKTAGSGGGGGSSSTAPPPAPLAMAGLAMMAGGDPAMMFNPYLAMNGGGAGGMGGVGGAPPLMPGFNPLMNMNMNMPYPMPLGMPMPGMPGMPGLPGGMPLLPGFDMFGNPMMVPSDFGAGGVAGGGGGGGGGGAAPNAASAKPITKPIIKSPTKGASSVATPKRTQSVSTPATNQTAAGESKRPASVTRATTGGSVQPKSASAGSDVTYTSNIPAPAINSAWLADNGYYFNAAKPQTPIPLAPPTAAGRPGSSVAFPSHQPQFTSPQNGGGAGLPPRSPNSIAAAGALSALNSAVAIAPAPQKNEHVRVIVRMRPVLKHETASGSLPAVFKTSDSSLQIDVPTLSEPASASLINTSAGSSNPKVSTPSRASRSSHSRSRSAHPTNGGIASTPNAPPPHSSSSTQPGATNRAYKFDHVFDGTSDQSGVFDASGIKNLVHMAAEGYAATVFAYGQTGSGKTYTMSGMEQRILDAGGFHDPQTDGLIPRSLQYVFTLVRQQHQSQPTLKFTIKASYLEIYNEQVFDLLNPDGKTLTFVQNSALSALLRLSPGQKNFFVENLVVVECANVEDLMAVAHEGHKNRTVGSHQLNKDSSRSHSIMTVYIESTTSSSSSSAPLERKASRAGTGSGGRPRGESWSEPSDELDEIVKVGKLSFVDLAGSENLKQSKNVGQTSIKETGNINKSLFTLGAVISDLGDIATGKKPKSYHVPYRNSLLTKLLMDSLGGTGLTMMIACVSPAAMHIDETARTLNYATRALNIVNEPVVRVNPNERLLLSCREEIRRLTNENQILKALLDSSKINYSQTLAVNTPYPFLVSPRGPPPPRIGSTSGGGGGGSGVVPAIVRLSNVADSVAGPAPPPPPAAAHAPVPLARKQLSRSRLDTSGGGEDGSSPAAAAGGGGSGSGSGGGGGGASVEAVMRENEKLRARIETLEKIFVASTSNEWALAPVPAAGPTTATAGATASATAVSAPKSNPRPPSATATATSTVSKSTPLATNASPAPAPAPPHTPGPPSAMTVPGGGGGGGASPAPPPLTMAHSPTSAAVTASAVTSPAPATAAAGHVNTTPTAGGGGAGGGTPNTVSRSMPIVRLKTADHSALTSGAGGGAGGAGGTATASELAARDESAHLRTHNSHLRDQNSELLKRIAALERQLTSSGTGTGTGASPSAATESAEPASIGSPIPNASASPAPSGIPRPGSSRRLHKGQTTPASPLLPAGSFTTPN